MKMNLILAGVAGLSLVGCVKKAAPTNPEPAAGGESKIVMASAEAGAGCHAPAVQMASATEGEGVKKQCATVKADGSQCKTKKAEMASADGAHCKTKAKGEMAKAESKDCADCPKTAEGKCDHEAGAKLGKDCCKKALEAKATAPSTTSTN